MFLPTRSMALAGALCALAFVTPCPPTEASAAAGVQAAPPVQGASEAVARVQAWLEAFNRADREAYRAFLARHFPSRLTELEEDLDFSEMVGGFALVKVESSTPAFVSCVVKERESDTYARISARLEAGPPSRLASLEIWAIERPADIPPTARLSEAELIEQLRARLTDAAARGRFSGAVLVARHDRVLFSAAHGLADRAARIPNTLDTRFRMGSMNKMFTATAILQLVQAGRVALDATLDRYLPDYPNRRMASTVTVHHLLTHTGGTGNIFGPQFDAHRLELRTLNDYVTLYGARDVAYTPGSRYQYSNYGFLLLGVIVERVTGASYYDYVRDRVFAPAGMTATGSEPEDRAVAKRAKGYMRQNGAWASNAATLPYRGTSAGGGYTTVGDLLRFARALTGHALLDARHTALLTSAKVEAGNNGQYAYGFTVDGGDGLMSFGHSGGAPGMNGDLRIFPASGYVLAALCNTGSGANSTTQWIAARLPRQP